MCEGLPVMHPEKILQGTVIGAFILGIEKTGRKFTVFPVVVETFAAFVLPAARRIGAFAVAFEFIAGAFHKGYYITSSLIY